MSSTAEPSHQVGAGGSWKLTAIVHAILFLGIVNFGSSTMGDSFSMVRIGFLLGQASSVAILFLRHRVLGVFSTYLPWLAAAAAWFSLRRLASFATNEPASAWWAIELFSQIAAISTANYWLQTNSDRQPISISVFMRWTTVSAFVFGIALLGDRSNVWRLEGLRWQVCLLMAGTGVVFGLLAVGCERIVLQTSAKRRTLWAVFVVLFGVCFAVCLHWLINASGVYVRAADILILMAIQTSVVLAFLVTPLLLPDH
ncbi:MAG: hypothetical protein AAF802_20245 [Planctomycetota bacterium]